MNVQPSFFVIPAKAGISGSEVAASRLQSVMPAKAGISGMNDTALLDETPAFAGASACGGLRG
jgi:hypothetical protein